MWPASSHRGGARGGVQLWLVEGGAARPFDGGMDKYHEHVLSRLRALRAGVTLQQAHAGRSEDAAGAAAAGEGGAGTAESTGAGDAGEETAAGGRSESHSARDSDGTETQTSTSLRDSDRGSDGGPDSAAAAQEDGGSESADSIRGDAA